MSAENRDRLKTGSAIKMRTPNKHENLLDFLNISSDNAIFGKGGITLNLFY